MRKISKTKTSIRNERIHLTFEIGVILKGLNGFLEIVGGFILLAVDPSRINAIIVSLTQQELAKDPNDFVVRHLMDFFHHMSPSFRLFGVLYLLSHGLIKLVLVAGLLRNKLWAYPASIIALLLFIFYQLYQLSYHPTFAMAALTVFDVAVIFLIWIEYKTHRKMIR